MALRFSLDFTELVGGVLLFCLVFGMSATVDIGCMMAQLQNRRAILTGIFLQFVILPFLGFAVVKTLQLDRAMGITLLVVTSSPGGSYSNWWCSMFNADLALSVTMTAISTILSIVMLPLNLCLYASLVFDRAVVASLDWTALFVSLVIVISAIGLGLLASDRINSHNFNIHANRLGNVAGISLVLFSAIVSSSEEDSRMWNRDAKFYLGVASPCVLGLIIANVVSSCIDLYRPERVTVSIECCYQNVGIATSVALTMFQGSELSEAMGVPFFYGMVEAVVLGLYCVVAWKAGWTKAPADENFCIVISTSYEVLYAEKAEHEQLVQDGLELPKYHGDGGTATSSYAPPTPTDAPAGSVPPSASPITGTGIKRLSTTSVGSDFDYGDTTAAAAAAAPPTIQEEGGDEYQQEGGGAAETAQRPTSRISLLFPPAEHGELDPSLAARRERLRRMKEPSFSVRSFMEE